MLLWAARGYLRLRIALTFRTSTLWSWKFSGGIQLCLQASLTISSMVLQCAYTLNIAVPHRVMQDDIHEGYFIPKGALVIPNIWYVFFSSLLIVNI